MTDLEIAINKAFESVQNLRPQAGKKFFKTSIGMPVALAAELSIEAAIRIREVLELGDIVRLKSIVKEL